MYHEPPDTDAIRRKVQEIVASQGSILGSKLGFELRQAFPGLDIKQRFGKLDTFLEQNCSDILSRSVQPGGHMVYVARTSNSQTKTDEQSSYTPWQAFVNPSITAYLYVEPDGAGFYVSKFQETGRGDLVHRMSSDDHRQIAESFVETADERWREGLKTALTEVDFWPAWRRHLWSDKQLSRSWSAYRKSAISDLLADRLKSIGIPEASIPVLTSHLQVQQRARSTEPYKLRSQGPTHRQVVSVSRLRDRVKLAIDRMSDAELQQVWLPVGAMLNVPPQA